MSSKAIQNLIIILFFATLIIPFLVFENLYFPYVVGKAFIFRIIVALMLILWAWLCIKDHSFLPKKNNLLISFLALVFFYFISALVGPEFINSFFGNYERMMGWGTIFVLFLFFLVISSVIKSKKIWNIFFFIQIISSLILFASGIDKIIELGINHRFHSTLGNPIYLAVIFMFSVLFAFYLLFENYSKKIKIFLGTTILINLVGILLTSTRGVMVGLLVAGIFILIRFLINYWGSKKIRYSVLTLLILVLVLPISIFLFRDSNLITENPSLNRLTKINITEGTGKARFVNWGIAWEGIKERPILGWGQENYVYVYDKHFNEWMNVREPFYDSSHNTLLDTWVYGGILSLISYVLIFVFAFLYIFKTNKINYNQKTILASILIAYFIQNLFVFDNLTSLLLFVSVISFSVSVNEDFNKEIIIGKLFLPITIFVSLFLIIWMVILPWRSNVNLIKGLKVFETNDNGQLVLKYENGISGNQNFIEKSLDQGFVGKKEIVGLFPNVIRKFSSLPTDDSNLREEIFEFVNFAAKENLNHVDMYPDNLKVKYNAAIFFANIGNLDMANQLISEAVEVSPKRELYLSLQSKIQQNLQK